MSQFRTLKKDMTKYFYKEWFGGVIAMILCFILCFPFFGSYFFSPNKYMYAFGGDAFAIYYDLSYHVCHGSGVWFKGMNYPHGELIFLTDAQGALTVILKWINQNIINICDYTVGILHSLNVISVILTSLVLYYILKALKCGLITSVIFAPLITMLSPQILRLVGHFGLAYPVVLPICILWFIRKTNLKKFEKRDILFFITLLFFSFNNPYVGAGAAGLLILATLIYSFWSRLYLYSLGLLMISFGFVLIPLVAFKILDPVQDRIKLQWGYFSFNTEFQGLVAPPDSLLFRILTWNGYSLKDINGETFINLGIISILCLLLILFHKIFKYRFLQEFKLEKSFIIILISTLLLYVYTSGLLFSLFDTEYLEENLGFLLMFKAVARLSWSLYFIITILATLVIDHIIKFKNITFILLVLSWVCYIWIYEIHSYIGPRFKETTHNNFLSKKNQEEIRAELAAANINIPDYQAVLCLPKMVMWSDNLITDLHFQTQFMSQRLSHATGIPLVSAMLSRISTGQALESIELLAHPLVEKSLQDKFPNKKDLLLLIGGDNPSLSSGEKYLITAADTLLNTPSYTLMRLPLNKINNFENQRDLFLNTYKNQEKTDSETFIYQNFESETSENISYYGASSKKINKGNYLILKHRFDNPIDSHYIFSVWTRVDHLKYGIGWFKCIIKNEKDEVIYEQGPDTRKSNNVHDEWIRTEVKFPVQKAHSVEIIFDVNRTVYIDELLISPENRIHIQQDTSEYILINGYRVKK